MTGAFQFCPYCSAKLHPFHDGERVRPRCADCGFVQYRNPVVGAAVVLQESGELLLGERKRGGWCIPCGYVEWDEPIEVAAKREFAEETGLAVELTSVLAVHSNFHDPERQTVGVWFTGLRTGGTLRPGGDLIRVQFHSLKNVPELLFPTDRQVLESLRNKVGVMSGD